jgi:hypothetical protein
MAWKMELEDHILRLPNMVLDEGLRAAIVQDALVQSGKAISPLRDDQIACTTERRLYYDGVPSFTGE